ncbi:MAG: DUF4178 domain-containing protein [Proteobacteria bacterium]|nr:DUF4178 domain-containing protein [Desulfobacula sp.]MBU3952191.1 DUF4178 domain-containing protein [Pseudomonadota bacterium]MBU4130012.1 DUF4178 domain-containing protein [Pseudomonadota bacterium]
MIDTAVKKSFEQRFSLVRSLDKKRLIPEADQTSMTLMDAAVGCFFTCFGDTYYVQEINRYQEMSEDFARPQDYFITELTCMCLETGHTGHFEWEFDDELEVSITLEQTSFKYIKDEEGQAVDEDDLDQIADDKDAIVYAGQKFWYEDDWAAVYQRNGKEEKVYMYEFENEGSSLFLTIEEWTGSGRDEHKIYLSKSIAPGEITIMSKGALGDDIQ